MKNTSIKKNFIMNAILTMSSFIFPLISFPYVSRVLMPAGTGRVAFATSIVSYFWLMAYLGVPTYGVRACAKVRDNKEKLSRTVQELLIISSVMTVIAYAVLFAAVAMVPRLQQERTLIYVISLEFFFYTIGIEWMYRALEQYTYITITSVISKLVALVAMFVLIHTPDDYVIYGGLTIFAASASYLFNFLYAPKFITLRPVGQYNFRRHFAPILVFFAMSCATMIYNHLDAAMLGFMKTDVDVGYYNAAVKIKMILVSVVTSLGTVLLPRSSYYIEQGRYEEFRQIGKKALNFVLLIATPLMLYFILYAKEGILLLSGDEYEGAILPMQIIMPTLLFIGLSNLLGIQTLVPLGREKVVLYSEIAGAVTDLVLNALLIPRYASAGAAFGTLVAEAVVLLVQYMALRKEMGFVFRQMPYGKIGLALVLGTAASLLAHPLDHALAGMAVTSWLQHLAVLAVSAILFFGVYGVTLLLVREPLLLEIWNSLRSRVRRILKRGDSAQAEPRPDEDTKENG